MSSGYKSIFCSADLFQNSSFVLFIIDQLRCSLMLIVTLTMPGHTYHPHGALVQSFAPFDPYNGSYTCRIRERLAHTIASKASMWLLSINKSEISSLAAGYYRKSGHCAHHRLQHYRAVSMLMYARGTGVMAPPWSSPWSSPWPSTRTLWPS